MPIRNILRKALVEIEAVAGRVNPDQFATWLENRNALLSWIQQAESSTSHAAFTEFIQQEVITCEFCVPTDAGTVAITPNSTAAVGSLVDQSNRYQQLTSACAVGEFNASHPPFPEFSSRATTQCIHTGDSEFQTSSLLENSRSDANFERLSPPTRISGFFPLPIQDTRNLQFPEQFSLINRWSSLPPDTISRLMHIVENPVINSSCTQVIDRVTEQNSFDAMSFFGTVERNLLTGFNLA
ncbi:hypothetical protein R1flu_002715 [Riccia fluitans]|uniref:Uncharacterized protein n=1 Tax=Riccia fluitans TaxID=41844 RepID=A0ABD1Y734_9MARC